jgi:hypothetical protein
MYAGIPSWAAFRWSPSGHRQKFNVEPASQLYHVDPYCLRAASLPTSKSKSKSRSWAGVVEGALFVVFVFAPPPPSQWGTHCPFAFGRQVRDGCQINPAVWKTLLQCRTFDFPESGSLFGESSRRGLGRQRECSPALRECHPIFGAARTERAGEGGRSDENMKEFRRRLRVPQRSAFDCPIRTGIGENGSAPGNRAQPGVGGRRDCRILHLVCRRLARRSQ